MWKMAIVYRNLSPGPGFPVSAMIFEPGAGLTELRHYPYFADAYIALIDEGWEPMHGDFDPTTYLVGASFRMKAEKKFQKAAIQEFDKALKKVSSKSAYAQKAMESVAAEIKK